MSHVALVIAAVAGFAAALVPVAIGLAHEHRDHLVRTDGQP